MDRNSKLGVTIVLALLVGALVWWQSADRTATIAVTDESTSSQAHGESEEEESTRGNPDTQREPLITAQEPEPDSSEPASN